MTLDRLAAGIRPYLLLTILVAAVALPGIAAVPPLDRDEARFAVASRQMVESGDWVTVHFQDELRAKKPPGIYWLQALVVEATGARDAIWAYRIPSALGILVAALALFRLGSPLVGRPAALIAAALLVTTPLAASEAHQAKTDAMLLACAVIAQGILARFYLEARRPREEVRPGVGASPHPATAVSPHPGTGAALIFWVAQAAAIMLKGPIVPVVSLLTVMALAIADRRVPHGAAWLRRLRPVLGLAVVIVLVAPWALAVTFATQGQFIGQAAGNDLLRKLYAPAESHEGIVGTYLILSLMTLWPAILFVVPGLVRAFRVRSQPVARFCLAWAIPSWIMFELVPTKLPHYVLPLVPALTLLAAMACTAGAWPARAWWLRLMAGLAALVGLVAAAGLIAAPLVLDQDVPLAAVLGAGAALAAGLLCAILALQGRAPAAAAAAVVGAAATWSLLFAGVLPSLEPLWVSQRVAQLVPSGAPAAAAGDHEPSLVFLLGTGTRLTDGPGAADFLLTTPHAVAIVAGPDETSFQKKLADWGRAARQLGTVDGLNYSHGKPIHLSVWTLAGAGGQS